MSLAHLRKPREGREKNVITISVMVLGVKSVHAAVDTFTIADWYDRFVALASAGAGAALAGFQV